MTAAPPDKDFIYVHLYVLFNRAKLKRSMLNGVLPF
jgi:hypothetical protein